MHCIIAVGSCDVAGTMFVHQGEYRKRLNDDGWSCLNGKGSFSLAVQDGMTGEDAPRLLRPQPEGEWMLMAVLQHNSAAQDGGNHTGLTLSI